MRYLLYVRSVKRGNFIMKVNQGIKKNEAGRK